MTKRVIPVIIFCLGMMVFFGSVRCARWLIRQDVVQLIRDAKSGLSEPQGIRILGSSDNSLAPGPPRMTDSVGLPTIPSNDMPATIPLQKQSSPSGISETESGPSPTLPDHPVNEPDSDSLTRTQPDAGRPTQPVVPLSNQLLRIADQIKMPIPNKEQVEVQWSSFERHKNESGPEQVEQVATFEPELSGPDLGAGVAEMVAAATEPGGNGPIVRAASAPAEISASATGQPFGKLAAESTQPSTPEPPPKSPMRQLDTEFVLAEQPQLGAVYRDRTPQTDERAWLVPAEVNDFSADPINRYQPYDAYSQIDVYQGKQLYANQRPLLELGRPFYQLGQLSESSSLLGFHNNAVNQFLVYGDFRTAVASSSQFDNHSSQWAFELNLNFDWRITSTERFAAFVAPLDQNGSNTRVQLDQNSFVNELNYDFLFGYFEGDLGAITGGLVGQTLPFDLPFAVGVIPLVAQNGIWLEDQFLGLAATVPARNSPLLDISNVDTTFFVGYDRILSPAFDFNDDAAKMYGVMSFIEALNGYFEVGYAFLEDRDTSRNRSYHNIAFGYSRRFGRWLSSSCRVIANAGQSEINGANTADGFLLLSENSLITRHPSTVIPYINLFAGFDRPQSVARAAAAGGILRNTGILFESDGMTGYPTLDASGNDTFGAAVGLNLLAADFSQQLVLELAALGVANSATNQIAAGDQYGLGFRYQLPLSHNVILRTDGMLGFLRNDDDIRGLRLELRHKF